MHETEEDDIQAMKLIMALYLTHKVVFHSSWNNIASTTVYLWQHSVFYVAEIPDIVCSLTVV